MPAPTYAAWPFRPFAARSIEEADLWWRQCYVPGDASCILPGHTHWRVIVGGPGSGKSVALAEVERQEASHSLIIRYPPQKWPGGVQAYLKDDSHLAQIMAGAALGLRDHLSESPDRIERLMPGQHAVLRWLLDRFLGPRTFTRWIDSLSDAFAAPLRKVEFENLYTSTTQSAEVYSQIDELVSLAKRLGFQRVLLSIDLASRDARLTPPSPKEGQAGQEEDQQLKQNLVVERLGDLFSWLDLMHHAGLSLIAAIPTDAEQALDLSGTVRGRVSIIRLNWSIVQVREIAARHLRAALGYPNVRVEDYADPALLNAIEELVESEYGAIVPQGWTMLAESLLRLAVSSVPRPALPFTLEQKGEVVRELFTHHFPLEFVERKGVWRGPRFVPLDPQLLRFTEIVWGSRDYPVNADDPHIRRLLDSVKTRKGKHGVDSRRSYIHTLAHRVRELIEPDPAHPIYLINDRGEGYTLDHVVRQAHRRVM